MDPVAIEKRRADIVHADSLDGGATAPSYANVTTLLDNSGNVRIPESFAKLCFVMEKAHILWYVLLGETHPLVEQHCLFSVTLLQREQEIESTQMACPEHQHIVPALLARRVQIDTNYWLGRQTRSRTDVCVPEFLEVFDQIASETTWASKVNGETITLAPDDAMQFGRALKRIITQIVKADQRFGPVKYIKIDIANGFYHI
jgi:hypothetical protein